MHFNKFSSRLRARKGIYLTVLIFCSTFVYSQSALNILDLYHETFPNEKAYIVTANPQIGDYAFHSGVGGISFQSVATPAENLKNENISLDYADNRLTVRIGTKTLYPDLPFWQLAPIVNFVNSSYAVAVSLSGDTIGNQGAKCRYHPAFLNNLLGLRLFQADLLNMPDMIWDLPVDSRRQYILASSEKAFTPVLDSSLHRAIYDKLTSDKNFTSFVMTDKDVNFVFEMNESGLKISGKPYYCFTKTEADMNNIQKLRTELIDCYKDIESYARLILKEKYTPKLNPRINLSGLVEILNENKQERIFNPYTVHNIENAINKLDSLNNLTDEEIGIQFKVLDDYSNSFKPYWELLKKYNPVVYSTVENTAQWAAFFRYVLKVNPNNWQLFVKKVNDAGKWDAPNVQTPTFYDINYFRYFEEKEKGAFLNP